jgi:drug/metabolite transporter (DMT)-like permease
MPAAAIACGILLILIGVIGYIYGLLNGNASLTALIPAVFGIVLAILGYLAKSKENLRMHIMHAAVLIGLLGFLIPAWRVLSKFNQLELSAAVVSQVSMALVCLVFVILCIKSFIDARRNRTA